MIRSDPPTAQVSLDGVPQGVTPLEIEVPCAKGRNHQVAVSLPGYFGDSKTLHCRRILGPKGDVFFELKPDPEAVKKGLSPAALTGVAAQAAFGLLEVKSIPDNAEVFLNEQLMGTTPFVSQRVKSDSYVLEVRKKGFKPWRKEIRINPKSTMKYYPILEEE